MVETSFDGRSRHPHRPPPAAVRSVGVRRIFSAVVTCVLLTGCGGSEVADTGPIAPRDLARLQGTTDDVARLVVSTLVSDLDAAAPSPDTLGRGLFAGCDGGDPDQAAYFVDTFITYDVLPPARAADQVASALRGAGLDVTVDPQTRDLRTGKGDVSVDLATQDKGGGSAGQNIYVSTPCLTVGEKKITDFNAGNGRDVSP